MCLKKAFVMLLLSMLYLSPSLFAQSMKSFSIDGDLSKIDSANQVEKVVLKYFIDNQVIFDTADVQNGKYQFKGQIPDSQFASLYVVPKNKFAGETIILLEPIHMQAVSELTFSNLYVTGSESQRLYTDWMQETKPFDRAMDSLVNRVYYYFDRFRETKNPADSLASDSCVQLLRDYMNKETAFNVEYAKAHIHSPIIQYIVQSIGQPEYAKQQEELYSLMPETAKQTWAGKAVAVKIAVNIGHVAPDFSIPDWRGKKVRLSSFQGKYVLLEFWASWCGPCRGEAPYLRDAFAKFSKKGFTIFSVSIDNAEAKQAWLNAIKKDSTGAWTQTSSLTGKNCAEAMLYGPVRYIPANFLLDPQGKIIAKNLRGDELEKKLKELLN